MHKILKHILFKTALAIVTLHTVISHPHSNELTREKHLEFHKTSGSFLGYIRLAFHESDDESLDNLICANYQCAKKIDFKLKHPQVSTYYNTSAITQKNEESKPVESNPNDFKKLFFVEHNGLRGPPILT